MNNDNMIHIRIRQRMDELSIKQVDIVKATGATKGAVSQWLKEPRNISYEFLIPLCKLLRCSVKWLKTGRGPIEPQVGEVELILEKKVALDVPRLAQAIEDVESVLIMIDREFSHMERAQLIAERYALGDEASVAEIMAIIRKIG